MHSSSPCVAKASQPSLAILVARFASSFRQAFSTRWRRRARALPALPDYYHAELEWLGVGLRPAVPPSSLTLRFPPV